MTESLLKLRKMTENLPPLIDMIKGRDINSISYDCPEGGSSTGENLFNNGAVSVQRNFMVKGTKFPVHKHPIAKEFIMVYEGKVRFNIDSVGDRLLHAGDSVYFQKMQGHSCEALEDTWLIGVTIPSEMGYPNG